MLVSWALAVAGINVPRPLAQVAVLTALGAALAVVIVRTAAALRSEDRERRLAGYALLALVGVSIALRLTGLGFELTDHFHNDEGVFLETAREINGGDPLPVHFHYPHLLYYLSALALWIQGLFPAVLGGLGSSLLGVGLDGLDPLTLRLLAASLGALTTVPVFFAARRAAGLTAGILAGALITLSPVYNEVAHLAISDVPAGFFAALTVMLAAHLLERESLSGYLLAGVAAGLAAASKYPAGMSALAIVAVWTYWRLRRRDLNPLLVWSGLASIATVLAVMPALWLRSESVVVGQGAPDILFGFRQYAQYGWIGVVKGSNTAYYLRGLASGLGLPALVAGLAGIFFLAPRERTRSLALLVYPVLFLTLLISMSMVVKRNLQPVLPAVAVVLGVGISAWPAVLERRLGAGRVWVALLVAICLVPPAVLSVAWDISRVRPGTRELALEWIDANVPEGSGFVKEAYTPQLHARRFVWQQVRYVARLELERILDPRWDYLLLARNAHQRFLDPERRFQPHHEVIAGRYERLFELELVQRFQPGMLRSGPDLLIYRLEPEAIEYATSRRFGVADVTWYSDPALRPRQPQAPVSFTRRGLSVLFKQHFEAGDYRVRVNPQPAGVTAWLYLVTRDNEEVAEIELGPESTISLPRRDKYFFRVFLSAGGELRHLVIEPLSD